MNISAYYSAKFSTISPAWHYSGPSFNTSWPRVAKTTPSNAPSSSTKNTVNVSEVKRGEICIMGWGLYWLYWFCVEKSVQFKRYHYVRFMLNDARLKSVHNKTLFSLGLSSLLLIRILRVCRWTALQHRRCKCLNTALNSIHLEAPSCFITRGILRRILRRAWAYSYFG